MAIDEAVKLLASRKLAARELTQGAPGNPEMWMKAVVNGIYRDHAGRIATMPPGLSVADQVKWIEKGPPAPGARIPGHPVPVGEFLPAEKFHAGLAAARAALRKDHSENMHATP